MVPLASLLDLEPLASRDVLAELDDVDDGAAVYVLADRRAPDAPFEVLS